MSRPSDIILTNKTYQKLAGDFYQHQLDVGYQARTARLHYGSLREFLAYLESLGSPQIEEVKTEHITAYQDYIQNRPSKRNGGKLSGKTIYNLLRVVRDLYGYLQQKGRVKINPCSSLYFDYPKTKTVRQVLSQSEIKTLYETCQTSAERALLSLVYGCGLRAGELEAVKLSDIRLGEKLLVIPRGKGNKRRVVPLSTGVRKDLVDYYENEREEQTKGRDYDAANQAFMLNSRGGRLRRYTANKYLKAILERTKNESIKAKQITLHSLRHTIATHLLEQGMATEQVRLFLGHSQLETTQQYTRVSTELLKRLADGT